MLARGTQLRLETGRLAIAQLVLGSCLVLCSACGGTVTYKVQGTPRVPNLHGTVQVERIEGESHLLTIKIRGLPAPEQFFKVEPGGAKPRYIAWLYTSAATSSDQYIKIGALAYHGPTHTGNIMATTQETKFWLRVTSESNPNTLSPGQYVVVEQLLRIR